MNVFVFKYWSIFKVLQHIFSKHITDLNSYHWIQGQKWCIFLSLILTKYFPFQSRALNGWARLVIGLLNRMYHEEELELRAKQFLYMRDREELLDEQLISHKNITHHQTNVSLLQTNTLQLLQVYTSTTFKIVKCQQIR